MTVGYPFLLRDAPRSDTDILMERYLGDLYTMFMNRLSSYVIDSTNKNQTESQLRAMFEEIVKVKKTLHCSSSTKEDTID